jgi:hypothetical protein
MGWNKCAVCGYYIGFHTSEQVEQCKKSSKWPLTWKKKKKKST